MSRRRPGDVLRLMARAETIKQVGLARKLHAAQAEVEKLAAQAGSIARLLEEHREAAPRSQNTAQLANSLRVGQQLEGHRNTLVLQRKQSERKLNRVQKALAECSHKLELLFDKARRADAQQEND